MSAKFSPRVSPDTDLASPYVAAVADLLRDLHSGGTAPAASPQSFKPPSQSGPRRRRAIVSRSLISLAAWLVLLCAAVSLCAQTTFTESVFSDLPSGSFSDLIQASDGNFYGTTVNGGVNNLGSVFQLTPAGVLTTLYSFSGPDGSLPLSGVIEDQYGYLWGTTDGTRESTDPNSSGTIFKITPKGQLTTLYKFAGGTDGGDPEGTLVQGSDGNFYGTTTAGGDLSILNPSGVFYRITPLGIYTVMATFTGVEYGAVAYRAGTMLQGTDGLFYGTSLLGGPYQPDGTVFSVSAAGTATLLWNFTGNADGAGPNYPPLVQVADGSFYGTATGSNPGDGVVFQYTPGNIAQAHEFSDVPGGGLPYSGLTLASDGNLYGTTQAGGLASCQNAHEGGEGCGTFYQINPKTYAFASLYAFGPSPDASEPFHGTPIQASDGNLYGVTYAGGSSNTGAVYKITASPSLPPPIQLSFSGTSPALPDVPVTLTWKVLNAFSTTAQQCFANIQGSGEGAGTWIGPQIGTLSQGIYSGSAVITPSIGGTYTYALTCGGRQSGFATLVVSSGYTITTTSLPNATVLKPYMAQLATTGGNSPDTWSIGGTVPNLPDGLGLDPATGIISGAPLQFGVQNVTIIAKDSSTPPNQTTATLPLTVLSGLNITTTSLVKGTVKANYKQLLSATGGLSGLTSAGTPFYNWSISAGKLPPGLTLGPTTGMITGKPTTAGTTSLTIQVADTEETPATATVTLNLVIAPTAQIAAVEFTQVIQQYQTLSDLQASLTTNNEPPVPMVTGKPAVMRVYFTPLNDATSVTLTATGAVAGTQILSLTPNCQPTDARAHNSGCPSMDFYFTPPTGAWTTTLTLTDDFGNQLEQETFSITSRDTYSINLKAVSACSVVSSSSSCQDPSVLLGLTELVSKLMPTNTVNSSVTTSKVSLNSAAYSDPDNWVTAMVEKMIFPLYLPADAAADASGQTRTDYVGVYDPSIDSTGIAGYGGHNVLVPARAPRLGRDATLAVVAHETGHTLGLTHTELDDPASTNGMSPGCYGAGAAIPGAPTNWVYSTDNVQSSAGPEYGFDVASQAVIDPANTYDIMSYCVPRWISPINYNRAFAALNGGTVSSSSARRVAAKQLAQPAAQPTATPPLVQGSYWGVSGSIQSAGVTLNPIFTETMSAFTDPGTGTYSIQAQSATGQALYTRYFTPVIDTTDTTGTDIITDPLFSEWIPVTAGTAAITVFDPNGNLLTNVPLTGAPPTVMITSPLAGFVGTGQQTVSWTIQSATATNFTSKISYSIDGGTTWQLIDQLVGLSDTLDFSTLPGATAALLRINVSDGVNTGSATSIPFSVPKKLPSTIVINSPVSGAIQPAKNPVYLTGAAYDADDGVLTGTALQWTDSAQGALGSGSPLTVSLKPGNHTITLTATDSDGNAITATTQITLGGDAPALSLTTNQVGTNCINATIGAVPGAQGADLTLVNYSLDGGATYTALPLTSLPFSFSVPGSGAINLVAVAFDASGQSSAQSAELNLGMGCAATPPVAITPTVTVMPSSTSITSTQAMTVTVAVSGGSGNPTPTGSVALTIGTYTSAATTLTNGSAMISIPAGSLAIGTDALTATYTPDSASSSTYNSAMGSNSVTVTTAPPATFALTNGGNIDVEASATTGNTATIMVTPSNGFTGTVNLTCAITATPANPTSPATCAVTPSVTISGITVQNATLTVNTTTTTTPGAYAVTVTGTSGAIMMPTTVNVSVTDYVASSFTLTNGGAIAIGAAGATTGNTTTITVMPSGGFTGNVTLTALLASSPSGAMDPPTFSFGSTSPVNIAGASNGTATLTVTTTAATSGALFRSNTRTAPWYAAGGTALACLLFFRIPVRRRRWRSMLGMFVLLVLFAEGLVGCIHKSSSNSGTATGSYTIVVTGTSGSITQTTTVNLTVN